MLIPQVNIPLLKDIPVVGEILSGHSLLTYIAFFMVFLTWLMLYKTSLGLNIRAVGENQNAADSVGVSVVRIKYIALGISGALAGLGGAYMSMYYSRSWNSGMIAGRGFIALAAQAMGQGEPTGSMWSSLLFGLANALKNKMEGHAGHVKLSCCIHPLRGNGAWPCDLRRGHHPPRQENAARAKRHDGSGRGGKIA